MLEVVELRTSAKRDRRVPERGRQRPCAPAESRILSDYRKVNDRVLTLENQRVEDKGRMERIENKIDRLLDRPK